MVVSHYVVSGIEVAGLIVGLMGFFYLSIGLFGRTGLNVFRPVFPALAAGIANGAIWIILFPDSKLSGRLPAAVLGLAGGYFLGFLIQGKDKRLTLLTVISVAVSSVIVIAGQNVYYFLNGDTPGQIVSQFILEFGTLAVLLAAVALVLILSERNLQYIGFAASTVAILTQFIPPVLDLFNIPVR